MQSAPPLASIRILHLARIRPLIPSFPTAYSCLRVSHHFHRPFLLFQSPWRTLEVSFDDKAVLAFTWLYFTSSWTIRLCRIFHRCEFFGWWYWLFENLLVDQSFRLYVGDDIASCSLAWVSLLRDDDAKLLRLNKSFWLIMIIVITIMTMMRMISGFGSFSRWWCPATTQTW